MEAPNTSPDGRGYAYPHIYNTYFSMYKIAENYPELVDYREDAETYLLRAYNIFCTQNNGSVGYGANCGTMGESSVPDIIEALEQEAIMKRPRTCSGSWKRTSTRPLKTGRILTALSMPMTIRPRKAYL